MIKVLEIIFGSKLYDYSIILRDEVLRKPLGLVYEQSYLDAEKDEYHLAAVLNGEVVGILLLQKINKNALKMRQVAVNQKHRRMGIGKQLVTFSEKFATKNGYKKIELNARETAVPFYKALDYKIIGSSFLELEIVHYKMTKQLI